MDDVPPKYALDGSWMWRPGPAQYEEPTRFTLCLAAYDRMFLLGLFADLLDRDGCVDVRLRSRGGLTEGRVRLVEPAEVARLAVHLKQGGFRPELHPTVEDEEWVAAYLEAPEVPEAYRYDFGDFDPLDPADAYHSYPIWAGPMRGQPGASSVGPKLCVVSTELEPLSKVLAALRAHPLCYGVKHNAEAWRGTWLGRAFLCDEAWTGWVLRQLRDRHPALVPTVQDDDWFNPFRGDTDLKGA